MSAMEINHPEGKALFSTLRERYIDKGLMRELKAEKRAFLSYHIGHQTIGLNFNQSKLAAYNLAILELKTIQLLEGKSNEH